MAFRANMMANVIPTFWPGLLLLASACTLEVTQLPAVLGDAGTRDSGTPDSGGTDGGDASQLDAGPSDAGAGDAGPGDAGSQDSGSDAGPGDACVASEEVCNGIDDSCNGEVDEGNVCPCDRRTRGDSTYLFCVNVRLTWDLARAACRGVGYDLAAIESQDEQDFFDSGPGAARDRWVGIRRFNQRYIDVNGVVIWDNGTALAYENFDDGMPTLQDGRNCVEVNGGNGEWRTRGCSDLQRYVCEVD